jgi:hypothetical protein
VRRSNSNSPTFAFTDLATRHVPALRESIAMEQFLYKKACRSYRGLKLPFGNPGVIQAANKAPAFFVSSLPVA